jgi:hypothetical protein
MNLLINLVGNAEQMILANNLDKSNFEIIKIDEKELSKPKFMLNLIKRKKYENVYFGTIDLNFQRFQFFIKLYLFLSFYWKGAIIDEKGDKEIFNLFKFLFISIPLFIFEMIYSAIVVIIFFPIIRIHKWEVYKT